MRRFWTVSILTLIPQLVCAASAAGPSDSLLIPTLKMLGALAVVIGLLLLFYAASRKGFGFLPRPSAGQIQVLETRSLGGKKYLSLVRVRGRELLIGISNERIECLTSFPVAAADFSSTLDSLTDRSGPAQEPTP